MKSLNKTESSVPKGYTKALYASVDEYSEESLSESDGDETKPIKVPVFMPIKRKKMPKVILQEETDFR